MHEIHQHGRAASTWGAALAILFALPSCGSPSMSPPSDRARVALEAGLAAWREGKRPGDIAGTDPPVQFADNEWSGGRKLAAFEILREEPSEADRRFVVTLRLGAPNADVEAVYVVLGDRPIAVFRLEDYERTLNMDNNPTPTRKRKR